MFKLFSLFNMNLFNSIYPHLLIVPCAKTIKNDFFLPMTKPCSWKEKNQLDCARPENVNKDEKILIISLCYDKLSEEEFVRPLASIIGKCVVKQYTKVTKNDIKKATRIILSGNALQDNKYQEHDWSWLKECKKPILGICAGMHAIGIAYGARILKNTRIGMTNIQVIENGLLSAGKYKIYELRQYGITKSKRFKTLSEKEGIPVMIQKENKYGVSFHPEVRMESAVRNFIKKQQHL